MSAPQPVAQDGDEDVLRREFIAATAGMAAGALPPVARLPAPRRVGMEFVTQTAARTARLRALDDYLGGAGTHRLYTAELRATLGVLKEATYSEDTGCALLSLAAEQAQQAGWAAFDAGWMQQAASLYDLSLSAATQAGDAPLAGNALVLKSYQQVSAGKRGTQAATAACRMAGEPGTPAQVRALVLERAAWAHAAAGQGAECDRALDKAAAAFACGGDRPAPGWASWADATELQIITGRCWAALRRSRQAVSVLQAALAEFADSHARDKALYSSWLAEAHLDAGEIEEAAAVTGRVLALGDGSGSVRPGHRAALLLRLLAPHRDVPAVADLFASAAADGFRPQAAPGAPATPGSPAPRR